MGARPRTRGSPAQSDAALLEPSRPSKRNSSRRARVLVLHPQAERTGPEEGARADRGRRSGGRRAARGGRRSGRPTRRSVGERDAQQLEEVAAQELEREVVGQRRRRSPSCRPSPRGRGRAAVARSCRCAPGRGRAPSDARLERARPRGSTRRPGWRRSVGWRRASRARSKTPKRRSPSSGAFSIAWAAASASSASRAMLSSAATRADTRCRAFASSGTRRHPPAPGGRERRPSSASECSLRPSPAGRVPVDSSADRRAKDPCETGRAEIRRRGTPGSARATLEGPLTPHPESAPARKAGRCTDEAVGGETRGERRAMSSELQRRATGPEAHERPPHALRKRRGGLPARPRGSREPSAAHRGVRGRRADARDLSASSSEPAEPARGAGAGSGRARRRPTRRSATAASRPGAESGAPFATHEQAA